ncbi:MAG: hypothetical protein H7Y89_03975 [Steroidobacteraceae bacterium]|nr:hypothetical protein [Steroidobacteraceae bacterium]
MPSPMVSRARFVCLAGALALLSACHDGDDGPEAVAPSPPLSTYSIGGSVVGSTGGLSLQNSVNASTVSVPAAGVFTFATQILQGASYAVVVSTPPSGQSCTVANGSGTMSLSNVTNIAVTCTTNGLSLGGVVSGLGAGKTLVLGAMADFTSGNVTITANGAFTFPVTFVPNAEYEVLVLTQPAAQTCTVLNGNGDFANAAITNISVTCIDSSASNRNWQTAVNVATDTDVQDVNGIRTPRVAFDAAGNALAVWSADREGDAAVDILWSRKPAGGAWTTPAQIPDYLPTPPNLAIREIRRDPVLAVAANGNAVAAWRQGPRFMGYDVMTSFYTPGTGWSTPEYIWRKHDDMPSGADDLQISQDSAGNTLVVWVAIGQIWYNRHTPGSGWTNPHEFGMGDVINELMGAARNPKLAQNVAGQAVVIWEQGGPINSSLDIDLWSTRYDVTTDTWSPAQAVEVMGGGIYGTSLVIDAVGEATAFWSQLDGDRARIRTARLATSTWSVPSYLETGNTQPTGFAIDPHAVIDGSGNITAVWQQGDVDVADFVAARYVAGTGWLAQRPIGEYDGSSSHLFQTELTVAGNAAGHVVVVWTIAGCVLAENVLCPVDVRANEFNPVNGDWGAEEVIDKENVIPANEGDALSPHVAVAPSGNAVAIWDQDGTQTTDGIRSAVFE